MHHTGRVTVDSRVVAASEIPDLLRAWRDREGISRRTLAEVAGVHRWTVAAWEQGRHAPGMARLLRAADVLGVEMVWDHGGETHSVSDPRSTIRRWVAAAAMTKAEVGRRSGWALGGYREAEGTQPGVDLFVDTAAALGIGLRWRRDD